MKNGPTRSFDFEGLLHATICVECRGAYLTYDFMLSLWDQLPHSPSSRHIIVMPPKLHRALQHEDNVPCESEDELTGIAIDDAEVPIIVTGLPSDQFWIIETVDTTVPWNSFCCIHIRPWPSRPILRKKRLRKGNRPSYALLTV